MTQYTSDQQTEFKRLFSKRRRRQLLLAVPLFLLIIAMAVQRDSPNPILGIPPEVYGPAFLVLVVAALIFSFMNWRCPACKGYLGKAISPRFCSKCGVVLQ